MKHYADVFFRLFHLLGIICFIFWLIITSRYFFPADWQLKDLIYSEYLTKTIYTDTYHGILTYFDPDLRDLNNNILHDNMRISIAYFSLFSFGIIFGMFPFLFRFRRFFKRFFSRAAHHINTIRRTHGRLSSYLFHRGATFLERLSQWAILVTLIFYLTNDRTSVLIQQSWEKIDNFRGKFGDFGRKDAIGTLVYYGVDIIGIDFSNANLANSDFSQRERFFLPNNRANFSLANFSNANLRYSNLGCSINRHSIFENAKLQEANFRFSDLRNANFSNAEYGSIWSYNFTNFSFVYLRGGFFDNVITDRSNSFDFYSSYAGQKLTSGAILYRADIRGATIGRDIIGIDSGLYMDERSNLIDQANGMSNAFLVANLIGANWDETTSFPEEVE